MKNTGNHDSHDMRIDARILKHLLHEATDMLEEAQTHALVEKHSAMTAHVLAQANWRMTATCSWAVSELIPTPGEEGQAARLHAPSPIFSRDEGEISSQLADFMLRVDRLHDRARRLDELSRGPMVSTELHQQEQSTSCLESEQGGASIIPLFGHRSAHSGNVDPVGDSLTRLRRAMAGHE